MADPVANEREATSIRVYKDELETLKRAKRRIEYETDADLTMHEALTMLAESFLESRDED